MFNIVKEKRQTKLVFGLFQVGDVNQPTKDLNKIRHS